MKSTSTSNKNTALSFRVYVTPEEKTRILNAATDCRLSMSAYCRTLALGGTPPGKPDLEVIDKLLAGIGNLNRLGGLMKMLLTNEERLQDMGRDMAAATIDGVLVDIRFVTAKMREIADALNGIPIMDAGEEESEE